MRRPIKNPDYENARYELRIIDQHGVVRDIPLPYRFNEAPTQDVFENPVKFREWQMEHVIWPFKYVEEP